MNEVSILGADLGMGANKLYGSHGGLQILSQVALNGAPKVNAMLGLSARRAPLEVKTACGSFYVGEGAHDWGRPIENLDYDRLTGAPEMLALFYAGLTRYAQQHGTFAQPVFVMAGLPLETMAGDEAATNAEAVRKWLKGNHSWQADGESYDVVVADAKCTSQPAAAFFDYVLDDAGLVEPNRRKLLTSEVGIVSIGFNTIELLVVRDKAPVHRFTAGSTAGVRRLLEIANVDQQYSRGELDVLLRIGRLNTSNALPIWAREVFGRIETQWGRMFRRFSAVIIVGGGALLLREQLVAKFGGRAVFPDDPVLSIARGLRKLALARAPKTPTAEMARPAEGA